MDNSNKQVVSSNFVGRGEPQVWATGTALSIILLIAVVLILVVALNGLGYFWPSNLAQFNLADGSSVIGEIHGEEVAKRSGTDRVQLKIGNRDLYGLDFRWFDRSDIEETSFPENAIALERIEYGNFYGFLKHTDAPGVELDQDDTRDAFELAWKDIKDQQETLAAMDGEIRHINYELKRARSKRHKREYAEGITTRTENPQSPDEIDAKARLDAVASEKDETVARLAVNVAVFTDAAGTEKEIRLMDIERVTRPNAMSISEKVFHYLDKLVELFLGEPRESNTEGGLFPAIFGTVMLVFLMSLFSFPFGIIAGVYLREYAKQGILVRTVRIAVNNLAGVPSIVYGIFGLGFFIYGIGGAIDRVFFTEQLPTPTFGSGGILWASLTLGLLTVPVVIVATEEALGTIPQGIREGSLSLGATKFQTLVRVLLPMASPGILTGFILAMARAAGEVAPLMITGVVKLAPSLPIDGQFPYIHAERKFMHLGFHIYDVGFQSPNVEAAKPMVFVTALLLVLLVLVMSSVAIFMRNRMKKRFSVSDF